MTGKMKMMTTGKMTMSESDVNAYTNFKDLFDMQKSNQINMLKNGMYDQYIDWVTKNERKLPIDHPQLASYHIQQLISEIGEVLDADKRWKNMRNDKYDKDNKLDEIADCFIVLMNITMYSGFDCDDLTNAIGNKINIVAKRIEDNKKS